MARTFQEIVAARLSRRGFLAAGAATVALGLSRTARADATSEDGTAPGPFTPFPGDAGPTLRLAEGHRYHTVLAWGDPLLPDAPSFDPRAHDVAAQSRQMGYNADFVGYLPLPRGAPGLAHGLLCVSSEYTSPELMWPDEPRTARTLTRERCDVDMAAHGLNVAEIRRDVDGRWQLVARSGRNRRVSAFTPIRMAGPAAGHPWLRTSADASGRIVQGTFANCSGGLTPWGTWLQAEENFESYFAADGAPADALLEDELRRARVAARSAFGWERHHARFRVADEPHEIFRHGWLVEIDPYDPAGVPVKRTALGRFSHEAASIVVAPDGRVVVYSGDDAEHEHVYKFVSEGRYDPANRAAARDLLDRGTLYVARLDDGRGTWLPLVFGEGPLGPQRGFRSQAEVLIRARQAATLLGATPMDRPEDVEALPGTGRVVAAFTKNTKRSARAIDAANPRGPNPHGHLLEWVEDGDDPTSLAFTWDLLLLAGPATEGGTADGDAVLSCPDNLAFDRHGALWVTTDGQAKALCIHDGVYRVPLDGPGRGRPERFLSAVPGAEVCGPCFTPDDRTLFVAIQHPGEGSTFDAPSTRFPHEMDDKLPPRPCVIAIEREDGKPVSG
ncbi:MAG: PhoX family phosphatase [Planctomycetota bacterium]